MATREAVATWLEAHIADVLGLDPGETDPSASFESLGLGSRDAIVLSGDLEEWLGRVLPPTLLYEFSSIDALAAYLSIDNAAESLESGDPSGAGWKPAIQAAAGWRPAIQAAPSSGVFWELVFDGELSAEEELAAYRNALDESTDAGAKAAPLSSGQKRLWFLDQLEEDRAVYNLSSLAMRIRGPLDVNALERAINYIAARHEPLRTRYATVGGRPIQLVDPNSLARLEVWDFRRAKGALADFPNRAHRFVTRAFDLKRGPLIRPLLARFADDDHIFLAPVHHVAMDGVSMSIFMRELRAAYETYCQGEEPGPDPLPAGYSDYAYWQRSQLHAPAIQAHLAYWREKLAGAPPLYTLTSDRPRPSTQCFDGATHAVRLTQETALALGSLARTRSVTLNAMLLSFFNALLARYTGGNDVIVGTPMAGRRGAAMEKLIGFFVNSVVLRTDLSGNPDIFTAIERTSEALKQAALHQDAPFDAVVEAIAPSRDMSHPPLFQIQFVHEPAPEEADRLGECSVEEWPVYTGKAKYDLTLFARETDGGLQLTFEFATALFEPATIARFAHHYVRMIDAALHDGKAGIEDIVLTNDLERRAMDEWNETDVPRPFVSIVDQILARAAETPDLVAVVCEGGGPLPSQGQALGPSQIEMPQAGSRGRLPHAEMTQVGGRGRLPHTEMTQVGSRARLPHMEMPQAGGRGRLPHTEMTQVGSRARLPHTEMTQVGSRARLPHMEMPQAGGRGRLPHTEMTQVGSRGRLPHMEMPQVDSGGRLPHIEPAQIVTYKELTARADAIASAISDGSAHGECRVAICAERSVDCVAGILGILRAGAAFVPIDPDAPDVRIAELITDSGAKTVLVTKTTQARVEALNARVVVIDDMAASSTFAPVPIKSSSAAYVIYTSGSTGQPKGVVVEHGNLTNYIAGVTDRLALRRGHSFAMVTTFAADLGYTALFPTLCAGGALHVVTKERAISASALGEYVSRHGIDYMKIVPSHLRALLGARSGDDVLPRTCIVLGGEALAWDLADRIHAARPELRVVNHYGPTETTVGCLTNEIDWAAPRTGATVPVGRPLGNVRAYVVDSKMRPAPPGLPGELCIAGAGVARGYLNRADLTAVAFVDAPFGERVYKTGDRTRQWPDGAIEFLGRADRQAKVRGYRVELGEIENVLRAFNGVADCAVLLDGSGGDTRINAYAVASDKYLSPADIRTRLRASLPEYMVPALVVLLDALPITPNGKLDARALPTPSRDTSAIPIELSTPTERALARLWGELLKTSVSSAEDNFLDLGGHSLLAIEMLTRVNEKFRVELALRHAFEAPTVRELAKRIDASKRYPSAAERSADGAARLAVTIQAGDGRPALFCVAPAGGTTFPYYALAHHLGAEQGVYCLQDPAFDGARRPLKRIDEMAREYVAAMRAVQREGPYHVAGWSFGGVVAYEIARLLGDEAGVVALIEAFAPESRRAFRIADVPANLRFAVRVAGSGLQTTRDSLFLMTNPRNGDGGLRRVWSNALYRLYLDRAQMAGVVAQNEELLGIDQPSTRRFLTIARANLKAGKSYAPGPYEGEVHVFKASEQPRASAMSEALGWERLVQDGRVHVHTIEGDHFCILRNPHVGAFARTLRGLLDEYAHKAGKIGDCFENAAMGTVAPIS